MVGHSYREPAIYIVTGSWMTRAKSASKWGSREFESLAEWGSRRAPWKWRGSHYVLHLLHARDHSERKRERERDCVCVPRNSAAPPPLQPRVLGCIAATARERERKARKRELWNGLPVEAPCVRETGRAAANSWRERGELSPFFLLLELSASGYVLFKLNLYFLILEIIT